MYLLRGFKWILYVAPKFYVKKICLEIHIKKLSCKVNIPFSMVKSQFKVNILVSYLLKFGNAQEFKACVIYESQYLWMFRDASFILKFTSQQKMAKCLSQYF